MKPYHHSPPDIKPDTHEPQPDDNLVRWLRMFNHSWTQLDRRAAAEGYAVQRLRGFRTRSAWRQQ